MKPVTIVGGGLAGLSLGIALRRRQVPVTIHDAGTYPRHRVCGEFICGIRKETLEMLGVDSIFEGSHLHRTIAFFHRGKPVLHATIPRPALGLSRYILDHRLARKFESLGGDLHPGSKISNAVEGEAGWVWAAGRHVEKSPWIGLKMHLRNIETSADLELHLGNHGYVGISAVEGGRFNVCGLFYKRREIRGKKLELLPAYLEASSLGYLSGHFTADRRCPESALGVSSVLFHKTFQHGKRCHLGDHYTVIPPFTGNGMSLAMESAALATDPLFTWCHAQRDWHSTVREIQRKIHRQTALRIRTARLLHPWIYHRAGQSILALLAKSGLLPFQRLFLMTH